MRGGLNFSSGQDAKFDDLGSRWGIKGSNEVSEGLSAVYQYEVDIDQPKQADNRLAYAGLSGGFGRVLLGKFTSATNAHNGFARDPSIWLGSSGTQNKLTNGISYGASTGPASFQVDAYLNPDTDTGGGIDQAMFGASFDMGFGKIGVGYNDVKDSYKDHDIAIRESKFAGQGYLTDTAGAINDGRQWRTNDGKVYSGSVSGITHTLGVGTGKVGVVERISVITGGTNPTVYNSSSPAPTSEVVNVGGKWYTHRCAPNGSVIDDCKGTTAGDPVTAFINIVPGDDQASADAETQHQVRSLGDGANDGSPNSATRIVTTATGTETKKTYGHSKMHASAKFDVAGVGLGLGYSSKESNDPMKEDTEEKTAYLALNGSAGDTGIAWALWARDVTDNAHVEDDDRSPWGLSVSRALGGGATAFVEHSNDDKPEGEDSTSVVGLIVNF